MSSNSSEWPGDAVEVGVVTGAWGVRGGLRIKPHAAQPEALFSSKRWWLRWPSDWTQAQRERVSGLEMPLRVSQAREQGDGIVATIQDLADRDLAEACKGARVFVSRASFPSTEEDEYYWVDLIGLTVRNRADVVLGEVVGLLQTGPHSVLRIQPPGEPAGPECLIPFVSVYIDRVDMAAREIHVDWEPDEA